MPTGYTAALYDAPQSLRDFILGCSRAMMPLISLRDEPPDTPVPDGFVLSPRYAEEVAAAELALDAAKAMPPSAAKKGASDSFFRAMESWRIGEDARVARLGRFEAMLAAVEAWEPPTEDHEPLKRYMVDQLTEELRYLADPAPTPRLATAADFRRNKIDSAQRDLDYARQELDRATERVAFNDAWVKALWAALPETATDTTQEP